METCDEVACSKDCGGGAKGKDGRIKRKSDSSSFSRLLERKGSKGASNNNVVAKGDEEAVVVSYTHVPGNQRKGYTEVVVVFFSFYFF